MGSNTVECRSGHAAVPTNLGSMFFCDPNILPTNVKNKVFSTGCFINMAPESSVKRQSWCVINGRAIDVNCKKISAIIKPISLTNTP
jgi:hypothetical protein